jgi:hypothetical protein
MKTHIGKIGRLPSKIRDAVGQRLEDGQRGVEILSWLNGLPDVQRVLREQFGGRPISKQNLSAWRNDGHVAWLARHDKRQVRQGVTETAEGLHEAAGGRDLVNDIAQILMLEIGQQGLDLVRSETNAERRWRRLCDLRRQLTRLRREDQQLEELAFQREKQAREERIMERAFVRRPELAAGKGLRVCESAKRDERIQRIGQGSPMVNLPQPQVVAKPGVEREQRSASFGVQASPTQSKQKI